MKKKIAILGSTGSIGKSLLNIIKKNKKDFEITLLIANKNYKELLKQTRDFNVKNVIILDKNSYLQFKKINKNLKLKLFNDLDKIDYILKDKVDYVMSSIVGLNGLYPTLKVIKFTKKIAIANKESIICGWNLIQKELIRYKTIFTPVDSEHFSILYAINKTKIKDINKIYLTASGGPLLNFSSEKIKNINIKDVLNHPTWKMGRKISVDSSTMMNKVFEIIEAKNIFNISLKKLEIAIHPQSYVHAIVSFNTGMNKIIAHETTMEIPIFNSLYENKNFYNLSKDINLNKLDDLNFIKPNLSKFPLLKLLKYIPDKISLLETVIVSANDELVNMYLNKKIKYKDISKYLTKIISLKEFKDLSNKKPKNISDIINLDKYVRLKINPKGV